TRLADHAEALPCTLHHGRLDDRRCDQDRACHESAGDEDAATHRFNLTTTLATVAAPLAVVIWPPAAATTLACGREGVPGGRLVGTADPGAGVRIVRGVGLGRPGRVTRDGAHAGAGGGHQGGRGAG